MTILTVLVISLGLSMDCLAVTVAIGFSHEPFKLKQAMRVAVTFGIFHILMPAIGWLTGWLIGLSFKKFISEVDHWIACLLLAGIGIKMIIEALKKHKEDKSDINKLMVLLGLSLATSIDALIIGVSLAFLDVNIFTTSLIFGFTTFVVSFIGGTIGKRFGYLLGEWAEILGGLVLVGLGVKILFI